MASEEAEAMEEAGEPLAGEPLAPGYVKDVRRLIQSFAEAEQTSLADFKALWKSRDFSFIHEGCPKNVNPRRYQQILYSISLGFLQQYFLCRQKAEAERQQLQDQLQEEQQQQEQHQEQQQEQQQQRQLNSHGQGNMQQGGRGSTLGRGAAQRQAASPVDVRGIGQQEDEETAQLEAAKAHQRTASAAAAAVYCIYCLFYTQHCTPPTLIYVSPDDVEALDLFSSDTGVHHEAWEALLCLQRLDREDAFLFGAVPFRDRDVFGCTEEEAAARRSVLDKQLQIMKDRLFSNLPVEEYFSADLGKVLGIALAERLGQQYDKALRAIPNPPAPRERAGDGSQAGDGGSLNQEGPLFPAGELTKILKQP